MPTGNKGLPVLKLKLVQEIACGDKQHGLLFDTLKLVQEIILCRHATRIYLFIISNWCRKLLCSDRQHGLLHDKSKLMQEITWCRQATSKYLNQY